MEDNARLDVKAQGFWGINRQCAYFDVRVFNPYAPTNCNQTIAASYRHHENEKRRAYEKRVVEVEHGSFTPIVMSSTGGWGPSAMIMYKRLASLIATKHAAPYSATMRMIRCKIAFSLSKWHSVQFKFIVTNMSSTGDGRGWKLWIQFPLCRHGSGNVNNVHMCTCPYTHHCQSHSTAPAAE